MWRLPIDVLTVGLSPDDIGLAMLENVVVNWYRLNSEALGTFRVPLRFTGKPRKDSTLRSCLE